MRNCCYGISVFILHRDMTLFWMLVFSGLENELWLELEEYSSSPLKSVERFKRYWEYERLNFNRDSFGKRLLGSLKLIYNTKIFEIHEFGNRCNRLWYLLPSHISQMYTLIYADDALSWGDETQTRELYERAFNFYDDRVSVFKL